MPWDILQHSILAAFVLLFPCLWLSDLPRRGGYLWFLLPFLLIFMSVISRFMLGKEGLGTLAVFSAACLAGMAATVVYGRNTERAGERFLKKIKSG